MQLEMISTGEEVLSGQIVDTNAAWFSDNMMNLGIELARRTTVGDRLEDLIQVFHERSEHADLILVNGGLGPTSDDLSAEAAAKALGVPLVEHQGWRAHLEEWFQKRGRTMSASNLKQCLLPEGAVLIDNPAGSAPGFRLKLRKAWLFFTPGVPSEFKPMVINEFTPFMQQQFGKGDETRLIKLLTFGHGESTLADTISSLPVPAGITLGYRPSPPHVEIKIFARGSAALATQETFAATVKQALGEAVVSSGFASLAEQVHSLLLEKHQTLSLAESCTGGMLSSLLIDFPGSSHYLLHGIVSYSNAAKQHLLQIAADTLSTHGAVSPETALAMARNARLQLDSDFALAISGIAGPDGGSAEKPVGTVAIALSDRQQSWVQVVALGQRSRQLVRTMSCAVALDMLRRRLLDKDPIVNYPFIPARRVGREAHH